MAKKSYEPTTDEGKSTWLNNLATKLPTHAATLGTSIEDQVAVQRGADMFAYMVGQVALFDSEKSERVAYKDLLRDGPVGSPLGDFPDMPVIPAAPTLVPPGIFPRIRKVVARIKSSANYTEAIGEDLDIIGAEIVIEPTELKPILKLKRLAEGVEIQWKKSHADAIRIEKDNGSGWTFLGVDVEPHYIDNTAITTSATWKYRAVYLINDQMAGQWSDDAKIAVG